MLCAKWKRNWLKQTGEPLLPQGFVHYDGCCVKEIERTGVLLLNTKFITVDENNSVPLAEFELLSGENRTENEED
ncbi:hypothetical protein [Snodgrassella alvi]|uniref:hypothetical protein n=1 Tax=Snodgrassella alvi TaxID=1196083 RepID=UPI0034603542